MENLENVIKNVIMEFQCCQVNHFQDTSTCKNFNRKIPHTKFKKQIQVKNA